MDKLQLIEKKRCHENWHQMTPVEKGSHCQKCDKVVFDFRDKSVEEIIAIHHQNKGKACGVYSKERVNITKPIVTHKKESSSLMAAGFTALLALGATEAKAQPPHPPTVAVTPFIVEKPVGTSVSKEEEVIVNKDLENQEKVIISGYVYNAPQKGNPIEIPFANILIEGRSIGVNSNLEGYYELDVTELAKENSKITLAISYVGYQTQYKEIEIQESAKMDFTFSELDFITTDITMMLGYYVPVHHSIPKRIWYWSKYHLLMPIKNWFE